PLPTSYWLARGSRHQNVSKWHEYEGNWQVYRTNFRKCLFSNDDQSYYRCREGRHREMTQSSSTSALFGLIFGWFIRKTSSRNRGERSHLCGVRGERRRISRNS